MSRPIPSSHRSRGFTLIEVMVVVAIIVILMAITVSVGISVKANAAIRSTHATLKSLEGMMKDYLATGSPEPTVQAWSGTAPYLTSNPTRAYAQTSPASDVYGWVLLLQADPRFAKQLNNLTKSSDSAPTPHTVILDAFGTPIRYVPFDPTTKKEGYFVSAGPDRVFATENPSQYSPALASGTNDDLYSYDP